MQRAPPLAGVPRLAVASQSRKEMRAMQVSPVLTQTAPGTFSTLADRLTLAELLAPILDAEQSLPRI